MWDGEVQDQSIVDGIATSDNYVIDDEGRQTSIFLGQRGSSAFVYGGRFFRVLSPNKNSGIVAYGGVGFLQHKISIKFHDDIVALSDEHKKGYDRFSTGFAFNGFVGYLFLSKNRLLNFFGGFDYTYGRTKSLRGYNYATNMPDNETYTDVLYGIRLGWIIRLNKRQTDNFYYD